MYNLKLYLCFYLVCYNNEIAYCNINIITSKSTFNLREFSNYIYNNKDATPLSNFQLIEILKQKDAEREAALKQKDVEIEGKKLFIEVTNCARNLQDEIKVIEYKYMNYEFIKHFRELTILAILAANTFSIEPETLTRMTDEELLYSLKLFAPEIKKLPQKVKFTIFFEWIFHSNEYENANKTDIAKQYRNGRLSAMVKAFRESFPNIPKDECSKLASWVINKMYDMAFKTVKDSRLRIEDVQKSEKFFYSILSFYENEKEAAKCKNIFAKFFSHPYQLTSEERIIMQENRWF